MTVEDDFQQSTFDFLNPTNQFNSSSGLSPQRSLRDSIEKVNCVLTYSTDEDDTCNVFSPGSSPNLQHSNEFLFQHKIAHLEMNKSPNYQTATLPEPLVQTDNAPFNPNLDPFSILDSFHQPIQKDILTKEGTENLTSILSNYSMFSINEQNINLFIKSFSEEYLRLSQNFTFNREILEFLMPKIFDNSEAAKMLFNELPLSCYSLKGYRVFVSHVSQWLEIHYIENTSFNLGLTHSLLAENFDTKVRVIMFLYNHYLKMTLDQLDKREYTRMLISLNSVIQVLACKKFEGIPLFNKVELSVPKYIISEILESGVYQMFLSKNGNRNEIDFINIRNGIFSLLISSEVGRQILFNLFSGKDVGNQNLFIAYCNFVNSEFSEFSYVGFMKYEDTLSAHLRQVVPDNLILLQLAANISPLVVLNAIVNLRVEPQHTNSPEFIPKHVASILYKFNQNPLVSLRLTKCCELFSLQVLRVGARLLNSEQSWSALFGSMGINFINFCANEQIFGGLNESKQFYQYLFNCWLKYSNECSSASNLNQMYINFLVEDLIVYIDDSVNSKNNVSELDFIFNCFLSGKTFSESDLFNIFCEFVNHISEKLNNDCMIYRFFEELDTRAKIQHPYPSKVVGKFLLFLSQEQIDQLESNIDDSQISTAFLDIIKPIDRGNINALSTISDNFIDSSNIFFFSD